jgi:hypothetical protein
LRSREQKKTFGPKWNEVIGGWKKLHYEKLHNLYSSSNITVIKYWWMKRVHDAALIRQMNKRYKILVRKTSRAETTW